KPPRLLERIIAASSDEGDMILDCFSGSGTTLAVASQLNRQWIGMDSSSLAIQTTLDRFRKGLSPMGDFVTDKPRQLPLLDFDTILDFSLYCDTSQSLSQISEAVTAWVNSISNT
ncbi:MAG: site-specific DNA-methyltransferase, partial [Anaerolineae bacterium]|nr:site-specific DNA-methyltransferase [Anaerolineae bacterium]